jgi:hypothetical protein
MNDRSLNIAAIAVRWCEKCIDRAAARAHLAGDKYETLSDSYAGFRND